MASKSPANLRRIPSVEKVKQSPKVAELLRHLSDSFVTAIVREVLEDVRAAQKKGAKESGSVDMDAIEEEAARRIRAHLSPALHRVINGTGIVIHTNLGRSILGPETVAAMTEAATHYCNLEIDLETGERGHRDLVIEPLVCALTGAEAATVVNNNAAAVMLSLDTFAKGREVIVSRGELIEIGGSFRIPDVMARSGAKLVEVGATNRTYITDYERALSPETGLLLKVHPSNYRIIGFANDVKLSELVELGRKRGIPVMEDLGSGALVDVTRFGLCGEPMPQNSVAAGADVVTFSGDKLLGGPQAGIILGKREHIKAIRKNPLMRAFRVDKLTLSALGKIFQILLSSREPEKQIPTLAMLARSVTDILEMAQQVYEGIGADARKALDAAIADGESQVGGGSCPGQTLPTKLLMMRPKRFSPDALAQHLRKNEPPVLAIIRGDSVCLDFRTILTEDVPDLTTVLRTIALQPSHSR
ncbi:MAG: L-seryl-tRNA(Sec) selenium transferase [Candidatus Abyssobacteria bacterium SURF_17]|uniref:L-seryl-tRNA(Sec) selenium transferase n=1 Tax=Candidatus Abyssobacteria bacterium SURF_17 TaxID=2093361 RepID=A0A419F9U1_9BACT|nr:MAG: L-seryl-tRNA(Sec) selenium transferase [Candidatus Abyssubacteria bacterium SURF_17]